jgi:hypothetical protein
LFFYIFFKRKLKQKHSKEGISNCFFMKNRNGIDAGNSKENGDMHVPALEGQVALAWASYSTTALLF